MYWYDFCNKNITLRESTFLQCGDSNVIELRAFDNFSGNVSTQAEATCWLDVLEAKGLSMLSYAILTFNIFQKLAYIWVGIHFSAYNVEAYFLQIWKQ